MTDKCPLLAAQEDARGWTVPPDNVEEMHKVPCLWCKVLDLEKSLDGIYLVCHGLQDIIGELEKRLNDIQYPPGEIFEDDDTLGECLMDHYPGDSQ